jgi:phage shock protein C
MMEETKRLYRIPSQGMIGGVCAGLGEYLRADPTLIRLIFVFLVLAGMSGVLIYIIMWIVVPVKPAEIESESEPMDSEQTS